MFVGLPGGLAASRSSEWIVVILTEPVTALPFTVKTTSAASVRAWCLYLGKKKKDRRYTLSIFERTLSMEEWWWRSSTKRRVTLSQGGAPSCHLIERDNCGGNAP